MCISSLSACVDVGRCPTCVGYSGKQTTSRRGSESRTARESGVGTRSQTKHCRQQRSLTLVTTCDGLLALRLDRYEIDW